MKWPCRTCKNAEWHEHPESESDNRVLTFRCRVPLMQQHAENTRGVCDEYIPAETGPPYRTDEDVVIIHVTDD
jgi:hypothetical protein